MSRNVKLPTVSFIVPNYNYGHYLGECLESAFRQTYEDWEIIIIDDTSTDNSREIARGYVQRYPEKIRLIELHDGPGGTPRAVNTGIRAMRGRADEARREELERALRMLARGEEPAKVLDALSQGLVNKLMHAPTQALNEAAGDEQRALAEIIARLFKLG